jgi:hypothetical protein
MLLMNEGECRNEELILRRPRHGQMKGKIIASADSFAANDLLEVVPRMLDGIEIGLVGLLRGERRPAHLHHHAKLITAPHIRQGFQRREAAQVRIWPTPNGCAGTLPSRDDAVRAQLGQRFAHGRAGGFEALGQRMLTW